MFRSPTPSEILKVVDHRPYPLPDGSWVMMQVWRDLLFAHWPLAPEHIRPLVPDQLELDLFQGEAWLAITPFHMDIEVHGVPFRLESRMPELNCRTYVRFGGKSGVFFFSLDAASKLAVFGARTLYKLPYFYSRMSVNVEGSTVGYSAKRKSAEAHFRAEYRPESGVRHSRPGTLEHWLTERYCLYACSGQRVFRGEIQHVPWPLQNASCGIMENTIAAAAGIPLPNVPPLLHYASELPVLIWPLRRAN